MRCCAKRSPIDVLREENRLLKDTIADAGKDTGADVPPARNGSHGADGAAVVQPERPISGTSECAEDYWSPEIQPYSNGLQEHPLPHMKPYADHDGTACFKWDDTLWSHADHFRYRWGVYKNIRDHIDREEGGMDKFTSAYNFYGLNRGEHEGTPGLWYREWAPGAQAVALVGEFNGWEARDRDWCTKNEFGQWALFLPDEGGRPQVAHKTKVRARVQLADGSWADRIPAWVRWATQEWNEIQFNGVFYEPPEKSRPGKFEEGKAYQFAYPRPPRPRALRVYECHVGMSSEEPKVNTYMEFKADMIPRIRRLGYNAIQIMAIQEHAYYGSFGYHVTNFFAPSSRCGTPDELKALIDEAHRYGMVVLMDIVHSHASKNVQDGISYWDGTDHGYFHSGQRGFHWMWDSRCFNYGNWETMRFLLSNTRYWLDEFKFDGFRFDGVTSMMYHHHGLQMAFTGNYDEYFGMSTDADALVYLMLMNNMVHDMFPNAITIGEDVSGMPAFCRPVEEGGIGYDYRLQMAIADMWIDVMKLGDDNAWGMGHIVHTLTNRRYAEPCVGYAESHDQALVGDKTIAFWLMDADMYDKMAANEGSPTVERGIALHKCIRLLTMALGGEGYLNFMGNEFGHPEWIDFPRDDSYDPSTGGLVPGNGGSFEKCRRLWTLATAEYLRYRHMNDWDRAIQHLDKAFGFIAAPHQYISKKDEGDKLIVVERGDLVFVFNFHPGSSYTDYRIGCFHPGPYKLVLSSDETPFGGWRNVTKDSDVEFFAGLGEHDGRPHSFQVYSPSRTVAVYAPSEVVDKDADSKEYGVPGLAVRGLGPYFAL